MEIGVGRESLRATGPFFAMLLVCMLTFVALIVMKTIAGAKRRELDPEADHERAVPLRSTRVCWSFPS